MTEVREVIKMTDGYENEWNIIAYQSYIEQLREIEEDPTTVINWGNFKNGDWWYDFDGIPHTVAIYDNFVILDAK